MNHSIPVLPGRYWDFATYLAEKNAKDFSMCDVLTLSHTMLVHNISFLYFKYLFSHAVIWVILLSVMRARHMTIIMPHTSISKHCELFYCAISNSCSNYGRRYASGMKFEVSTKQDSPTQLIYWWLNFREGKMEREVLHTWQLGTW